MKDWIDSNWPEHDVKKWWNIVIKSNISQSGEVVDIPNAVDFISKIIGTEPMRALSRLSPYVEMGSVYSATMNIMDIINQYTREEWIQHCEKVQIMNQDWFRVRRYRDIELVWEALQNIEELRTLWSQDLIRSDVAQALFINMCSAWKTNRWELNIGDKRMLNFITDQEMKTFINFWFAIMTFSPVIQKQIDTLLDQNKFSRE